MIDNDSTKIVGNHIVDEATGDIWGIDDKIQINKKYIFAIRVYWIRMASIFIYMILLFTYKEVIPSVFWCFYIVWLENINVL